jgi:soluble lytic murein transglycosylase-like protein/tetratricopeptide (TPR) repeat protein
MERAVAAFSSGDLVGSRVHLEQLLRSSSLGSAVRTRAHFLLGWISSRLGNNQQASANFYRVRKLDEHPLKQHAAFFEARADLRRGHPRTAVAECGEYREQWPGGRYEGECMLLEADGLIALGKFEAATERYERFIQSDPDDTRLEPIALRIAQSLERAGRWKEAARRYRALYLQHQLPTTAKLATAGWDRMVEAGYGAQTFTDSELYRRAVSLRSAAQFDESMDLYLDLDRRNPGTGKQATAFGHRLDAARHSFLWKNRKYDHVGKRNAYLYDQDPDHSEAPDRLHWAIEGLLRAGQYKRAASYLDIGRARFPKHVRFRNKLERHMKIYQGAGRYSDASLILQEWRRGSSRARSKARLRFLIPYYAYRTGDFATAITGFDALVGSRSSARVSALYYRGKAKLASGDRRGGRADHRKLSREFPDHWYSVVLRSRYRAKEADPAQMALARTGRWPGKSAHEVVETPPLFSVTAGEMVRRAATVSAARPSRWPDAPLHPPARDSDGRLLQASFDGWSNPGLMSLGMGSDRVLAPQLGAGARAVAQRGAGDGGLQEAAGVGRPAPAGLDFMTVPPTWETSSYWDPAAGRHVWEQFAKDNYGLWPDLPVAYELSQVGLFELAGPIVASVFKEIRHLQRSRRSRARVARFRAGGGRVVDPEAERWTQILDLAIEPKEWRQIFGAAGYPASVTDFAIKTVPFGKYSRLEPEGRAVWTLNYPAAFGSHVWRAAWEHDVDPLLMLAVMRVESRYRHDAVSRAGALGLVQIMPATGHRVAALLGDSDFRVDRLLEPGLNIRLGTFYLGELMRRFGDRQFALAVSSYNGGPHNIGRWLHEKTGMPFEEFVEEIQFRETRAYTRRVLEYYAVYCELYGNGAWPLLPDTTTADDPRVINF